MSAGNTKKLGQKEEEITMLCRVVREGLPETVTFEPRPGKARDGFAARND